jgi:transglutaminase-like putative cysteine protease
MDRHELQTLLLLTTDRHATPRDRSRMLPLICSLLLHTPAASHEPNVNLAYSGARSETVQYQVDFRVIVTAPQNTKKLRVWVPIPPSDGIQHVTSREWSTFPLDVKPTIGTETVFGNTFAYFEFAEPQGAQIITHRFQATTANAHWNLDPKTVNVPTTWPSSFDPYRRNESLIKVDDQFQKLATQITAGTRNRAEELSAVMDWVSDNLTYDHSNTSLVADSTHALTKKRGDCSDYHGLCSSLGRSLGVPTRVTYGLHLFPKNLPSHCKLEAYLPPYGWVSFDVSETQRLIKRIRESNEANKDELIAAATNRLRRGFRDNTWLLVTRGTEYELVPRASRKVPLVSTIWAEADGVPLPAPDPADVTKREFAWMTSHQYTSDRAVAYPFRDWRGLK